MPQLDPTPWFETLVFTWLVFLTVVPPKVAAHTFSNEPALQDAGDPNASPQTWTWTWHQTYSTNL